MKDKPRLAVVSPFLDKRHGTERRVLEWVSQLAAAFEIHIYSQRVDDLDLSRIVWHRIPKLPGPHLLNYIWWVAANRIWRGWDRRFRGLRHDLTFSPGPNCLDADVMSVHVIFAEYLRKSGAGLSFRQNPVSSWARLLHRKLYYSLVISRERRAYTRPEIALVLIAQKMAADLARFYGRRDHFPVIYAGLDHQAFNSSHAAALRDAARKQIQISAARFAVLLIGNDWRNKGLPSLLAAAAQLPELPIDLLIVGEDDPAPYQQLAHDNGLAGRVHFLSPRSDVEHYYAAADVYVCPSLEDAFALPVAEAMACGLPVIASATAGASEIITDGVDGLILKDPTDSRALAAMLRRLYEDSSLRAQLGERAAQTTQQFTWERNGRELAAVFEAVLRNKRNSVAQSVAQEL